MDKVNHILQLFQDSREPYVIKYLTVKLRDVVLASLYFILMPEF